MLGVLRPLTERATGLARRVGSDANGLLQRVRNGNPQPKDLDDTTIARKVESVVFRSAGVPKEKVVVDVVEGVVTLRGEVKNPTQKQALETAAKAIPEVRGVENLLKLPKTPSPTRADAPGRAKRTGGRKAQAASTRRNQKGGARFNRERAATNAEPSPAEHAAEGKGRTPAPMGSQEGSAES